MRTLNVAWQHGNQQNPATTITETNYGDRTSLQFEPLNPTLCKMNGAVHNLQHDRIALKCFLAPGMLAMHILPSSSTHRGHKQVYPALVAAFTPAPFSSSAFTLLVWPFSDARCNAVFLHAAETLPRLCA